MPPREGSCTFPKTPTSSATTPPVANVASGMAMPFCALLSATGPASSGTGPCGMAHAPLVLGDLLLSTDASAAGDSCPGSRSTQHRGTWPDAYPARVNAPPLVPWSDLAGRFSGSWLPGASPARSVASSKDLLVYQYGGREVLAHSSPYAGDDPITGLPFTYPPFAAVLMVPLALLPTWLAAAAVERRLGGRARGIRRGRASRAGTDVARLARRPAEPSRRWPSSRCGRTSRSGRSTCFSCWRCCVDLLRPERRLSGVALGIAAGVKLTPLVFIVLLVLAGHRAAATRAVLAFGFTVAVGFAAVPGSAAYWTDRLLDPSRVGPPGARPQPVGLRRADASRWTPLRRLTCGSALPGRSPSRCWSSPRTWWRRGDRVLATCLGALAMLLASPIAWSHHWVWVVPIALVLWERSRWAAAAWTAVFVARPILWPPWGEGRELRVGSTGAPDRQRLPHRRGGRHQRQHRRRRLAPRVVRRGARQPGRCVLRGHVRRRDRPAAGQHGQQDAAGEAAGRRHGSGFGQARAGRYRPRGLDVPGSRRRGTGPRGLEARALSAPSRLAEGGWSLGDSNP